MKKRRIPARNWLMLIALLPGLGGCAIPAVADPRAVGGLQFLDDRVLRADDGPLRIPAGGLSEVAAVDAMSPEGRERFVFIVDDREEKYGPARALEAELIFDLARHRFSVGDRRWRFLATATAPDVVRPAIIDGEALRVDRRSGLFIWASEGDTWRKSMPGIFESTPDGVLRRAFPLPAVFVPDRPGAPGAGVRPNRGFEALDVDVDGRRIIFMNEDSLAQDGAAGAPGEGPPVRVTVMNRQTGDMLGQHVYRLDFFPDPPRDDLRGGTGATGAVSMLWLEDGSYLVLERAFRRDAGVRIRLYHADPAEADDVRDQWSLAGWHGRAARKTLLGDLLAAGLRADNWEGMAFGPDLPDGRKTLVLVTDDNFNQLFQSTIIAWIALPSFDEVRARRPAQ